MKYEDKITKYLEQEIRTLQKLDIASIDSTINLIRDTYEHGKRIYIFGNGGSSSTASHFQNDFNKGISETLEKKFNFVCLNDNIATLMAIANDFSFEEVFRYQLKGRLEPGDIIMAISGSGNSPNVINAVTYAKEQGNKVIGITGYDGGKLRTICDISMHVPINSMQIAEDIHMIFDHLMMSIFYEELCNINHIRE
jgi:D-sedoheptulose 7-phosphate isomerase